MSVGVGNGGFETVVGIVGEDIHIAGSQHTDGATQPVAPRGTESWGCGLSWVMGNALLADIEMVVDIHKILLFHLRAYGKCTTTGPSTGLCCDLTSHAIVGMANRIVATALDLLLYLYHEGLHIVIVGDLQGRRRGQRIERITGFGKRSQAAKIVVVHLGFHAVGIGLFDGQAKSVVIVNRGGEARGGAC